LLAADAVAAATIDTPLRHCHATPFTLSRRHISPLPSWLYADESLSRRYDIIAGYAHTP